MKTIFDSAVRNEIQQRISALNSNNTAHWGKMNVHQMIRHCTLWNEMILQNKKYKRVFIGLLLGRILLKNELKDDRPMRQNNPTIPELRITEATGDFESAKMKWIASINKFENYTMPDHQYTHPFFGKMTTQQIGLHAYKHTDHHLRQFGC